MKNGKSIGNNGIQLVDILESEGLFESGMTVEKIEELARPYMVDERYLHLDSIWEDVAYRAQEIGKPILN